MTNEQLQSRLTHLIEEYRREYGVPSIEVSVHRGGETFFCGGGLADVEEGRTATPDTIYAIASASKAFIATSLCMLASEGKLDLDRPVKDYLPGFEMNDPYMTGHMTTRDALSHRTGLPRHDAMWLNLPQASLGDLVHRLRHLPPAFPPRYRMHYQNHMFTLASHLVQELTGAPWQDFVQGRIFQPLGMEHSYCRASDYLDKGLDQAAPYALEGDAPKRMPYLDISHVGCAGCLCSTVRDLDRWARVQLGRGELEGKRVFPEAMAGQLHSPQMIIRPGEMFPWDFDEVDFTSYGLGWFVESYRGHKLVHHGGTIDGFKSLVGFLPKDGLAFSILTNLDHNQSTTALGYALCDLSLGLPEIDWLSRLKREMEKTAGAGQKAVEEARERASRAPAPPRELACYAGTYESPGYGSLSVRVKDGQLLAGFAGRDLPMLSMGYDGFYIDASVFGMMAPARFASAFEGEITGLSVMLEPECGRMIPFDKVN